MDALSLTVTTSAWSVPVGTKVYDVEGAYLGKVRTADAATLIVASGWLVLTQYAISLTDVGRYEEGQLALTCAKADMLEEN